MFRRFENLVEAELLGVDIVPDFEVGLGPLFPLVPVLVGSNPANVQSADGPQVRSRGTTLWAEEQEPRVLCPPDFHTPPHFGIVDGGLTPTGLTAVVVARGLA